MLRDDLNLLPRSDDPDSIDSPQNVVGHGKRKLAYKKRRRIRWEELVWAKKKIWKATGLLAAALDDGVEASRRGELDRVQIDLNVANPSEGDWEGTLRAPFKEKKVQRSIRARVR